MKKLLNIILCFIFFHKLKLVNKFAFNSYKLYCTRCKRHFGLNTSVKAFIPWDKELEEVMLAVKKIGY